MYRFGEDFDYDSNIEDLFLDYLEKTQKKDVISEINVYINYEYYDNSTEKKKDNFVCQEAQKGWLPWKSKNEYMNQMELEEKEIEEILSPLTAEIYPQTKKAVEEADFDKSPIYKDKLEKAMVQKMVEDVYKEVEADNLQKKENPFHTEDLLKALIEFMIVKEIYEKRKMKL